MFTILLPMAWP